mmetsp:Transcript_675/g.1421  ORF Transcript_675/g.1421 Transcript_675/m.1421 type:complete len:339 (+) Transcript_675:206-1222(+)
MTMPLPESIETAVIWLYAVFTLTKAAQWMLHTITAKSSSETKKSDRITWCPSLRAATTAVNFIGVASRDRAVEEIPRKEYQVIADPMLREYTSKCNGKLKKGRSFSSLEEARRSFFQEYTNRNDYATYFWSSSIAYFSSAQLAAPLGLVWLGYAIPFFFCSVASLINEKCFATDGNVLTWVIHVAIATTITDVYIVCCKEHLSWEEGIRRYKWLNVFNRPQVHPLMGVRICPMYKCSVIFPPDVMEFELEVREQRNSMPIVREKKTGNNSRTILLLCNAAAVLIAFHFYLAPVRIDAETLVGVMHSILRIAPSATVFYCTRFLVDRSIGTSWDNSWAL